MFAATLALSRHLGMQTCVSQDRPGFLVNRMLLPLINEAFFLLMEVSLSGLPCCIYFVWICDEKDKCGRRCWSHVKGGDASALVAARCSRDVLGSIVIFKRRDINSTGSSQALHLSAVMTWLLSEWYMCRVPVQQRTLTWG